MPTRCSERGGAWIALLAAAALAGAINGYMFLLAAVIVRILTVTESRRPCEVAPLEVFGVIADPARLPALIARVARIATALKVRAPTRIIVGLKPGPWVSTAPIRLQDGQVLPPGETLYLSPLELRALRSRELDAFIAHELGHFRAPDLPFTRPCVPAMRPPLYTCQGVRSLARNFIDLARLRSLMVINGKAWVLKRAAGSIRQWGEFGADRAALAVAGGADLIAGLAKLAMLSGAWSYLQEHLREQVSRGIGPRNLVLDCLDLVQEAAASRHRAWFGALLVREQIAQPTDTHPTLVQRAAAAGVEAPAATARALQDLALWMNQPAESRRIEEELTALLGPAANELPC